MYLISWEGCKQLQASIFGKGSPFFSEKEIFVAISAAEEQHTVCKRCQYLITRWHSLEKTKKQIWMPITTNLDGRYLELTPRGRPIFFHSWMLNKITERNYANWNLLTMSLAKKKPKGQWGFDWLNIDMVQNWTVSNGAFKFAWF